MWRQIADEAAYACKQDKSGHSKKPGGYLHMYDKLNFIKTLLV